MVKHIINANETAAVNAINTGNEIAQLVAEYLDSAYAARRVYATRNRNAQAVSRHSVRLATESMHEARERLRAAAGSLARTAKLIRDGHAANVRAVLA